MFKFLLSSSITCADAETVVLRIQANENLKAECKIELIETIQDYTSECPWDANDWRNGKKRIQRKLRRFNFHPSISGVSTMNTLNLIKKQIDKAAALHDAQVLVTKYRGVDCKVHQASEETHGTYCYRGRTYVKWYGSTTSRWDRIPWFCSIPITDIWRD